MSETPKVILVVDDEPDIRELLADEFKMQGYSVLEAPNGNEAFELVKSRHVDAVVSDVRMSNGDGVELLERLKKRDPFHPKVFLVSGYSDLTEVEGYDRGAEGIFPKPFDRKALCEAVERSLVSEHERKRKNERLEARGETELLLREISTTLQGQTSSIGRGGMFVALTTQVPPKGTRVSFRARMASPELGEISGTGIVRWCRKESSAEAPSGVGIEFQTLHTDSSERLTAYVERHRPTAFIPKS